MQRRHLTIALALCLAACATLYRRTPKAQVVIAEQARDHVGERATVCDRVVSAHFASMSRGRPTFLNLGRPYPHAIFTVVIWGKERAGFGQPEKQYRDKQVCVTGFISVYRGQPDMTIREPGKIRVK